MVARVRGQIALRHARARCAVAVGSDDGGRVGGRVCERAVERAARGVGARFRRVAWRHRAAHIIGARRCLGGDAWRRSEVSESRASRRLTSELLFSGASVSIGDQWADELAGKRLEERSPDELLEAEYDSIFRGGLDRFQAYNPLDELPSDYTFDQVGATTSMAMATICLQTNPHLNEPHLMDRAAEAMQEGQTPEAILYYEAAVQRDPRDANAWCKLGRRTRRHRASAAHKAPTCRPFARRARKRHCRHFGVSKRPRDRADDA